MLKFTPKRNIIWLVTVIFLMGILAGCSGGGSGGGDQSGQGQDSAKVMNMSISTGATSGTYYPLGTAIANVVSNAGIGVNMTAESTSGSIENARLIGQGQTEIGFVESLIADWAYNGKEMFEGQKVENIRGLVALYPNTIQTVVKKKSGIKTYKDLKGKTVAVGIQGSSSPMAMQVVLESYGMSMNDIKPQYLAYGPSMELLKDDQVHAVMVDAGAPNSSIIDVGTQHEIDILSIDPENIAKIREKYPYFSDTVTIPAGTYNGVDKDIITPVHWPPFV